MTTRFVTALVPVSALQKGDVYVYSGGEVTVDNVASLGLTAAGGALYEVTVLDERTTYGARWIDYVETETINVIAGPSAEGVQQEEVKESATQRALAHLRRGVVSNEPPTAASVLLTVAALQDEGSAAVSPEAVASVLRLSRSTVFKYASTLIQRGALDRANAWAPFTVR